jgi:sugar (pentulose or hexulose) kinase
MDLLVGLDLGTSAIKSILVSAQGEVIASEKMETALEYTKPGHVEFSAEGHYDTVCSVIRSLTSKVPSGSTIKALSMASASGNTVLLDNQGKPIRNAISWMDKRAGEEYRQLLPEVDESAVYGIVGWPFRGLFPLAHLAWLKKHEAERYSKAAYRVMQITYVYHRLCGKFGIDPSTATTFYLQDQVNREWHEPFLKKLDISSDSLPKLMDTGQVLGTIISRAAKETGLGEDVKVVLGTFDHPCAARGAGVFNKGDFLVSCGTSWVGFYPCDDRDLALSQNMLIDPYLTPGGPWGVMFSLPGIAVNIDWVVDKIINNDQAVENRFELFDRSASECKPGAGGLFISPFQNPADVPEFVSTIKEKYSTAQVSRALMEGTAFEMRRKMESLAAVGIKAERMSMVGGPAQSPIWPQILADVTGLELKLMNGQSSGAMGAALIAGVGAGVFKDEKQSFKQLCTHTRTIESNSQNKSKYDDLFEQYKKEIDK